jgi:predicted nucleotidyltransferase component of viral defense system
MNMLIEKLKNLAKERREEGTPENAIINAMKEEIQYAVLDFIYNNRAYYHLVMYGGTLLRIGYNLPRMSEDLDFQTHKKFNFVTFKKDVIAYFKSTYNADVEMTIKQERLTGTDFAYICFPNILKEVGIRGQGIPTTLKISIDVNFFHQAKQFS